MNVNKKVVVKKEVVVNKEVEEVVVNNKVFMKEVIAKKKWL